MSTRDASAKGDPASHQLLCQPELKTAFHRLKLHAIIYPENLSRRRRRDWRHHETLVCGHGYNIGEIVLSLRVLGRERRNPASERLDGSSHDPGVDLADRAIGRARVPVLHDTDDPATGIAPHPAVAIGPLHRNGKEGDLTRADLGPKPAQRNGLQTRHVAIEDHDAATLGNGGKRLGQRVPGTEGPGLLHPAKRNRVRAERSLEAGPDGLVPVHDVNGGRSDGLRSLDHPCEKRASRHLMEHLGAAGPHPLAVAGCENDDLEVRHARLPPRGRSAANKSPSLTGTGGGYQARPERRRNRSRVRSWATASASSARAFA